MSFTTILLHNTKAINVRSQALSNPDGSKFTTIKVAITDERGHMFEITAFSDRPVPVSIAPDVMTEPEVA